LLFRRQFAVRISGNPVVGKGFVHYLTVGTVSVPLVSIS
jgi:hypothetical protein